MTLVAERTEPVVGAASRWRRAVPGAAAVLLVFGWIVLLIVSGSPAADVLKWTGAVLVGALVPGLVVVRIVRRAAAPLVEDLAWGSAAGCLVGMLGWFLDRVLPWSPGAYVVGVVVIVLGVAVPSARRRVLAAPAPGWGVLPSLALAGTVLISYSWMYVTGLRDYPVNPGRNGLVYAQDNVYQLSLLGELRRTLSPTYAPVAGTPLHYHWFVHAIDAHLIEHTGVDPWDVILRLTPATLVPAVLVLAAVVARRMAGWVWAGPLAALLLGVLEVSQATRRSIPDGTIGIVQEYWMWSETQTLGWLAGLGAVGCLFAYVRRSPRDAATPVALFVPMLILAAGAKSAELPVILAGIGLAAVVQAVRRDWVVLRRCLVALLWTIGVFLGAAMTIYGFNSYGLRFELWGYANWRAAAMFPGKLVSNGASSLDAPSAPVAVFAVVILLVVLPELPRLLGLVFQLRYRAGDPTGWICLGGAVAGLVLPFAFQHPGLSQIYFLESAYPIGVVGAASGLCLLARRAYEALDGSRRRWRLGVFCAGLFVAGGVAAAIVAYSQPRLNPIQRWAADHPRDPTAARESGRRLAWLWLAPTITLVSVLGCVVVVVGLVLWRRNLGRGRRSGFTAPVMSLTAMCLLLGTGLFALALHFGGTDTPVSTSAAANPGLTTPLPTMPDQLAAGRYIDAHAGRDDIVATNIYCRTGIRPGQLPTDPCDARGFSASAFAQRRTLVGGWVYSDRVNNAAWGTRTHYTLEPFWNPALLDAELAACDHPTETLLAQLYRDDGVRWVYVDFRESPVDVTALDQLAVRRFLGPTAGVWQLKPPAE